MIKILKEEDLSLQTPQIYSQIKEKLKGKEGLIPSKQ